MGLLDALIFGVRDVMSDATALVRRSRVSFNANDFDVSDDAINDWTKITVKVGAGLGAGPLANSGTGTINDQPTTTNGIAHSAVRHTGVAPTVTGYQSGTSDRRMLVVATGGPVILANESASSQAVNRIVTGTGGNVTIPQGAGAWLWYDIASTRWRLTQIVGGSASAPSGTGFAHVTGGAFDAAATANMAYSGGGLVFNDSGFATFGATNPAATGDLRFRNLFTLKRRNAAAGADQDLMQGLANELKVAGGADITTLTFNPATAVKFQTGNTDRLYLDSTGFQLAADGLPLIIGSTAPATTGDLRVRNGFLFKARNAANSANFTLMELDGSNFLWVGSKSDDTEKVQALRFNPVASTTFLVNGSTKVIIDSSVVQFADNVPLVLGQNGVAAAGDLRMRNQRIAAGRNAGDTADVRIFTIDASDRVVLGENVASRTYIVLGTDCQFTCNNGEMIINNFTTQPIYMQHGSSGFIQRRATGEEYGRWLSADVQTTDATVTTLLSGTVGTNTAYTIEAYVTAQATDNTTANGYMRIATVRDSGGILNLIGAVSTPHTAEADAALDVTIDVNANDWRVRVTGKAALTVDWRCMVRIMKAA